MEITAAGLFVGRPPLMAGQAVPSTADATGKITRSQSLKKTSTCLEDTLMFPGVRVFFLVGERRGGGGRGAIFVVIDNKQKIDRNQNLQCVYTIILQRY